MTVGISTYHSAEEKTDEQACFYAQTHDAPHRYLAYRNIPDFVRQFVNGKRALDYGCGTGSSSSLLYDLGLDVTGTDVSKNMLKKARQNFPHIQFCCMDDFKPSVDFDLIFSSFVLFEFSSKEKITKYLEKASSFLKDDGIFIGITGSKHLYSLFRNWFTFDVDFRENHQLISGKIVKIALKSPHMEFFDYYWKEEDYLECFKNAELQLLQTYFPLGFPNDPYPWKDELFYSPFVVFIAKKS